MVALSTLPLWIGAVAILLAVDPAQHGRIPEAALLFGLALGGLAFALWLNRRPENPQAAFFELGVDRAELPRGAPLRVTLRTRDGAGVRDPVEIGLVCTEFWDDIVSTGQGTSRTTRRTEAFAEWHEAGGQPPAADLSLSVPADAPFSYEGDSVSWAWRVSARERRPRRQDRHRDIAIWVTP